MPKKKTDDDMVSIKVPRGVVEDFRNKLYICTDHDLLRSGELRASYVVAPSEAKAIELLDFELVKHGLQPHKLYPYSLVEVDLTNVSAEVLVAG